MYAIVSTEILFLLISFLLFYKFKLDKTFISRIFKGITIYLPLTDQDFQKLVEIKKSKAEKVNGIVRSCEIDEYSQKTKEPCFFNFDFIVIFFLCNIFVIILNETKNMILIIIKIQEVEEEYSFNIIASFSFATFVYFVYLYIKDIFRHGFWNYDTKVFYSSFIVASVLFYLIELFQSDILGMNLESVNKIVNDRLEKVNEKASAHYQFSLISTVERLRVFYALIFGLFIGILFKASMRLAYFDNFLLMTENKTIQINKEFNYRRVSSIIKWKIILNIFLLFLLIDPLVKFPLKMLFGDYYLSIYLFIFMISIISEICLGIYTLWFDSFFFHLQNYTEVMNFASKATKESLFTHRLFVNYMNTRFWDIILHIFSLNFYPLLITIIFYSRSQLPQYVYERISLRGTITQQNPEMKVYFFENIIFVISLAFACSKAIISNVNVFYMHATHQLHNSIY